MQKTKEITFEGVTATISSNYGQKKVSITVKEPNVTEIFESMHLQDLKDFAREHYHPQEIFSEEELKEWANSNGYIKE